MAYTPFKRQDFAPSCPSGGTWWSCGYGTFFVGCCARDPCDITCAQGNLYAGAFDPASYGKFPDATCGTGSKFYTCTAGKTFWGCCKTNACSQGGCPDGDLEPAILNRDDLRSAYHATGGSTMTSATRTSTSSATSASRTVDSQTTSATASAVPKDKAPVAAIAGGAAGGAFALAVIITLLVYYCCHAKKSRRGHTDTVVRRLSDLPAMMAERDKAGLSAPDAPPGYSSPDPNFYPQGASQYQTYAHHQQYHQYIPEPQELPIEPVTPGPYSAKPVGPGHQRGASELSGDTALRSELGTPLPSPKAQQMQFAQQSSPRTPQSSQFRRSPLTLQTQFGQQNSRSVQSHDSVQNWVAHQSWQTQTGSENGHHQGLGVQGLRNEDEAPHLSEQREYLIQPDGRRYPGI